MIGIAFAADPRIQRPRQDLARSARRSPAWKKSDVSAQKCPGGSSDLSARACDPPQSISQTQVRGARPTSTVFIGIKQVGNTFYLSKKVYNIPFIKLTLTVNKVLKTLKSRPCIFRSNISQRGYGQTHVAPTPKPAAS